MALFSLSPEGQTVEASCKEELRLGEGLSVPKKIFGGEKTSQFNTRLYLFQRFGGFSLS